MATFMAYRNQFHRDVIMESSAIAEEKDLMKKGVMSADMIDRLFYISARSADPEHVPASMTEFFESLPMDCSYVPIISKMYNESMSALKKK